MVAIYICSTETRAGKTMLAIGLAKRSARGGSRVGYFKPISFAGSGQNGGATDGDVAFAKQVLSLSDSPDVLSPVALASRKGGDDSVKPELAERIKDSFTVVARNKDVILAEGPRTVGDGARAGVPARIVAELLGAKTLLVARYRGDATIGKAMESVAVIGQQPAGVIVNGVPVEQLSYARQSLVPQFESIQIPVLGILPLERDLLGASVGELASYLGGTVLCCTNNLGASVDSVMIGARSFDSGLPYFARMKNKALVARAEKPDMHLAALETATSCIIATGGAEPSPVVVQRAMEVDVPLIKVEQDTAETIDRIEEFLANVRFRQAIKVKAVERLIDANVDFDKLSSAFGLPPR